ncbi:hypothetical protein GHV40_14340 [Devosia sp. D6-9]|nr:hypothetical protein GHV40_14340 [Devosia sp. D6-9]
MATREEFRPYIQRRIATYESEIAELKTQLDLMKSGRLELWSRTLDGEVDETPRAIASCHSQIILLEEAIKMIRAKLSD